MRKLSFVIAKAALLLLLLLSCVGVLGLDASPALAQVDTTEPFASFGTADPRPPEEREAPVAEPISWMSLEWWTSGAFLIYITGILLGYAGWMLNASIFYFIIEASNLMRGGIGNSIVEGWTIIRDIINITFVFGLIYIAFMTVMKADTHPLKHAIPKILIFAILINFSLLFAKIIVDFSNVTSLAVYTQMTSDISLTGGIDGNVIDNGISGYFMKQLGLLELFDGKKAVSMGDGKDGGMMSANIGTEFGIGYAFMISILMLIASFVFIAGALLVAIRFIVIVLLLMLSPIAFASGFIPKLNTEEWAHSWWKNMVSQAIFAPAYLLMIWLAMKMADVGVMSAMSPTTVGTGEVGISGFLRGYGNNSIGPLLNFIVVAGLLVASLIVAKKAGAYGASSTMQFGKSLAGGTSSILGRNSIGRISNWRLNKYNENTARRENSRVGRFFNRTLYYTGAHDTMKGGLGAGKTAKFGGSHSYESRDHDVEEYKKGIGDNQSKQMRIAAVLNYKANPSPATKIELERALKTASTKELEDLGHDEIVHNAGLIGSLSHSQIEDLMKSDHLSGTDKAEIGKIRQSQIAEKLSVDADGNAQTLSKGIPTANTPQLKALGVEKLLEKDSVTGQVLAGSLSSSQLDDLKKELTETEFGLLKKAYTDSIISQFGYDDTSKTITGTNSTTFFAGKSEKEIAKLPKAVLKHKESAHHLTKEALKKLLDNGDLTTADRSEIRQNLQEMIDNTSGPRLPGKKHPMQDFLDSPMGSRF